MYTRLKRTFFTVKCNFSYCYPQLFLLLTPTFFTVENSFHEVQPFLLLKTLFDDIRRNKTFFTVRCTSTDELQLFLLCFDFPFLPSSSAGFPFILNSTQRRKMSFFHLNERLKSPSFRDFLVFHLPQGPLKSNFFYCPGFLPAFSQFRNGLNATFFTVLFTRSDEVQLFLLSKGALPGQVKLFLLSARLHDHHILGYESRTGRTSIHAVKCNFFYCALPFKKPMISGFLGCYQLYLSCQVQLFLLFIRHTFSPCIALVSNHVEISIISYPVQKSIRDSISLKSGSISRSTLK